MLVTADGGWRRGQVVPLKQMADEALEGTPSIKNVVVVQRLHGAPVPVHVKEGRDHWYHRLMQDAPYDVRARARWTPRTCSTSSTRPARPGSPRASSTRPAATWSGTYATTKWVFDLKDDDVYWCTADIGWVTGHSYVVYGPLANGATVVMYEGAPDWPQKDRFWEIIERYGVTIFYTAPTAIRAFMKWGTDWPAKHDLSSLRLLGSVGEPINPEAWIWYHRYIGGERCPVVDTWWQTETGAIMITPLPGVTPTKPGSATRPFPGIKAEIKTDKGETDRRRRRRPAGAHAAVAGDAARHLRRPRALREAVLEPLDARHLLHRRRRQARRRRLLLAARPRRRRAERRRPPHRHDGGRERARRSPAGRRGGGGRPAARDQGPGGRRVRDAQGRRDAPARRWSTSSRSTSCKKIGAIARPDDIIFTADLPKTRSGKIMRRLLRDIAEGKALGDTTTLADPAVVARLKEQYQDEH